MVVQNINFIRFCHLQCIITGDNVSPVTMRQSHYFKDN